MKKSTILLLLTLFIYLSLQAQNKEYGLLIQSFPLSNSLFTTLNLDDGHPIETKGEDFSIDFQVYTRNNNVFGTVFRIITDQNKNIDLLYSVGQNDQRFPILVTGDIVHPIQKEVKRNEWLPVSLTFSPQSGDIRVSYDGLEIKANYKDLTGTQSVRISFGYCLFDGFSLADVASVNIKDVYLKRGQKLIRHWKMAEHNDDICYDEIAQAPARTKNATWLIDNYITWKQIYTKEFPTYPSIAFDPTIGTFYIAYNNKHLYVLHTHDQSMDTITVKGGAFAANYPNQLIYIPQQRQLLSYNLDENLFSTFNPMTQSWENKQAPTKEHDYWNNTINYNPADSTLISFGGYGHYHYNNELLISYPFSNKEQLRIHLTDITPRYSCSSTIVDSTLYIFGGRGCPSGRQELSPRNYYDLYSVNLLTRQVNKLWEAPQAPSNQDFHPGENMVYDQKRRCFYLFCSQLGGVLLKFNLDNAQFETMSLPIGANVDSQFLYSNLYYSPQQQKLYACFYMAEVNGKSTLKIYELNYPPIPASSFVQNITSGEQTQNASSLPVWIYILLAVIAILIIATVVARMKRRKLRLPAEEEEDEELVPSQVDIHLNLAPQTKKVLATHYYDLSQSSVCFFGGFRVFDKEGREITMQFTPVLKHLLILLILYTGKDPKGIIGQRLLSILWSDKMPRSAQNSRNVYISKLRNLMERVGDIKIVNQNNFYSIHFGDDVKCDYLLAIQLFNNIDNDESVKRLIELLLNGAMLPNVETDWVDTYKTEFSNRTIDLLNQLLKQDDLSDSLKLGIANTMFQHDFINEEALHVKCTILYKQGKKGLAQRVYDQFCKEYTNLLGVEYPMSLKQILGEEYDEKQEVVNA